MSVLKQLALSSVLLASTLSGVAAEGHGVSPRAEELFRIGSFPVTNSMVTSWAVALVVIVLIRLAIRQPKLIPSRGQAIVESLVQGVLDLISPIVGGKVAKHAFPLLVALFLFILTQNWSGLFPGVGTVFKLDHHGHWISAIRPGNADMNMTLALALTAMAGWLYFVLRYAGAGVLLYDLFGNKADRREIPMALYIFLFFVFFGVGLIEVISIVFRPISLSFRLYGNVLGGENLLHAMSDLSRWFLPIPFYFLELLIGFVQALVFTLLVSVYIGLICNHGDDHGEHHEGAHGKEAGH